MAGDEAPHILVVDDDRKLRGLLGKFLTDAGYRASAAADAAEARAKLAAIDFDLMVVDVMMPGESGLELLRDLRRTSPVPVLMLTAMGETADRIAGLESGADDYLAKPFEPKELLLRIAAVLKRAPRAAPAAPAIFRLGPYAFDAARGELTREGQSVKLTTGEAHLLKVMAARPGETFTRVALGEAIGIASDRAIDVQVTRLRRKIETDPRNPRILCTVWGEGYVLHPD